MEMKVLVMKCCKNVPQVMSFTPTLLDSSYPGLRRNHTRQSALDQWTTVFNWGSAGDGMPDGGNEVL